MMDCRGVQQQVYAYLDGELSDVERGRVDAHLRDCAACREQVQRERQVGALLRARLAGGEPAPATLRSAILNRIRTAPRAAPWPARLLASPWTPRLAMAAVLALLLLLPLQRLVQRTPALASAAAARHACHDLPAEGPLPPCCRDLGLRPGDVLADPSDGARVPDLEPLGLRLVRATRCDFEGRVVNMMVYHDARSQRFSLYTTDRDGREFKLLRTRTADGVTQARHSVTPQPPSGASTETFDVAIWQQGNLVYTWVGAHDGNATFDTALARLQGGR